MPAAVEADPAFGPRHREARPAGRRWPLRTGPSPRGRTPPGARRGRADAAARSRRARRRPRSTRRARPAAGIQPRCGGSTRRDAPAGGSGRHRGSPTAPRGSSSTVPASGYAGARASPPRCRHRTRPACVRRPPAACPATARPEPPGGTVKTSSGAIPPSAGSGPREHAGVGIVQPEHALARRGPDGSACPASGMRVCAITPPSDASQASVCSGPVSTARHRPPHRHHPRRPSSDRRASASRPPSASLPPSGAVQVRVEEAVAWRSQRQASVAALRRSRPPGRRLAASCCGSRLHCSTPVVGANDARSASFLQAHPGRVHRSEDQHRAETGLAEALEACGHRTGEGAQRAAAVDCIARPPRRRWARVRAEDRWGRRRA